MVRRKLPFSCLVFALALGSAQAKDGAFQVKYFGEGREQQAEPKPFKPAPEHEDFAANFGRSPAHIRAATGGVASAAASGDTAAPAQAAPGLAPAFGSGERPRDGLNSSFAPERSALHAGPAGGPARRPPARPMSPDALGHVFDASVSRPQLAEPKAQPRPWPGPKAPARETTPAAQPAAALTQGAAAGAGAAQPGGPALVLATAIPAPAGAGVFVTMDLDLAGSQGRYKDAVEKLSRAASFSRDARFLPVFRDSRREKVQVWGWVPPSQLSQLVAQPGVERVEATPQAPASAAQPAEPGDEWRLLLRLPGEPAGAAESGVTFAGTLLRLSEAGFVWRRSEPRNSSGLIAVVGTMPSRNLGWVMGDPAVVRVEAVRRRAARPAPASIQASAGPGGRLGRFLESHPVFLLLIVLLPLAVRVLISESFS